jgi:putative ABC transport system permease protein
VLVGWDDATTRFGVTGADAFAVRFAPNAPATTRVDLTETARESALEVVTLDRVAGAIEDALDRVFGLFDALAIIAVIVAALGIANTLTMNVIERVREIGILRAAGMTTRQVWRSVVVEAGVVGLAGALVGVVTGVLVGALMVVLAGGTPDVATLIPWPTVAVAFILWVALAMLAAAYPARLAARISIVRAVAYE